MAKNIGMVKNRKTNMIDAGARDTEKAKER